jgi:hypothetical protein
METQGHAVLLGDSIFDNGVYVGSDPDVASQVRAMLPGWRVTLLAVDGDVAQDVERQLGRLPRDATHLVVSAGGNNALGQIGILSEPASSYAEVLARLADIGDEFGAAYDRMLRAVLAHGLPTTVCTIYDGNLDALSAQLAGPALAVFNDRITRAALSAGTSLIDLRQIFTEPRDYANPIEPSAHGGAKMAQAIARAVTQDDSPSHSSRVFR